MLQLSIQDYEGKNTLVPLAEGELTIGRDDSNAICLTERNVSRQHARIIRQGQSVQIENMRATWGTRLNATLLQGRVELQSGDVVQIGDYTIELLADGNAKRDTALVDDGRDAPSGRPPAPSPNAGLPDDGRTSVVNLADIQRELSAPVDQSNVPAAEQPRLVVESENLRGLELRVTRSPTVIGRVQESADLVIDHRSISKEHARLTRRPDGSWEVLDLGSSNGIQVNGEPYSKVAIRSGDVLILGHVKLRFLAPGDRAPAGGAAGGSSGGKGLIIAAVAVALLLGGGLAAFLALSDSKPEEPAPKPVPSTPDEGAPSDEAGTEEQAPAPSEGRAADAGEMLRKVEKLRRAGMVREALEVARAALKASPGSASLGLEVKQLEVEAEALGKIDAATAQVDSDPKAAYDAMVDLREALKDDSPLVEKTESLRDKARAMVVATLVTKAEEALKRRKYDDALDLAEQAQAYDADNEDAAKVIVKARSHAKSPKERPAAAREPREPRAKPEPKPVARPEPKPEPKPIAKPEPKPEPKVEAKPAAAAMSGQEHYSAGRRAAAGGDKQGAIDHFNAAVKGGYKKAHGQLARLYFQVGDKANCLKHGNAYIQRYPDAADAPQIEGMLEKCR
ncbi:MAG: hypothetical protein RIT45_2169 [Pseudomonadota bacterium]|jgi:pSer/pThr/pTyr-binding forkhead associated (FHA) protein/outer membrane biosynthesis protein TonB